jgi:hypothetical protein
MSTTIQSALRLHHATVEEVDLTAAILKLLHAQPKWQGTASELKAVLSTDLTARALSQKLHQYETVTNLQIVGVSLTWTRNESQRLLTIVRTAKPITVAITTVQASKGTNDAKTFTFREPAVEFPWSWPYAEIRELSPDERRAVAHRRCGLCHERGSVTHSKRCEQYPQTLLCKSCCLDYISKAQRVMVNPDFRKE